MMLRPKSTCVIQLHLLKEAFAQKKMGIPQELSTRGNAPQGGNSHVFDSHGRALLRQGEALPPVAALP
jgi:hypothetical protein